jgi:ubiquitin-protein ligase
MDSGLAPATMKRLMKEYADIAAVPMEGVMLLANEDDMTCVQALIEGPVDTPYEGGIFRVSLKLGNDFPMAPPKGSCPFFFFFFFFFVTVTLAQCDGVVDENDIDNFAFSLFV